MNLRATSEFALNWACRCLMGLPYFLLARRLTRGCEPWQSTLCLAGAFVTATVLVALYGIPWHIAPWILASVAGLYGFFRWSFRNAEIAAIWGHLYAIIMTTGISCFLH